jgi:hypothetical protein
MGMQFLLGWSRLSIVRGLGLSCGGCIGAWEAPLWPGSLVSFVSILNGS